MNPDEGWEVHESGNHLYFLNMSHMRSVEVDPLNILGFDDGPPSRDIYEAKIFKYYHLVPEPLPPRKEGIMERLRVILTSVVTVAVVLAAAATQLAEQLPGGPVAEAAAQVAAVLVIAISTLRRVTPVLPQERGVLEQDFRQP